MDAFMKKKVMSADNDGIIICDGGPYYKIDGVENYFLRYDGKVIHEEPYSDPEVVERISDPVFNSAEEAINFLLFFDARPYSDADTEENEYHTDLWATYGLENNGKTFYNLMKSANTDIYRISPGDIQIVADKQSETITKYVLRPRVSWGKFPRNPIDDESDMIHTEGIFTTVLKPVDTTRETNFKMRDTYFITNGPVRKMVQITKTKSVIGDNFVFRCTCHGINPEKLDLLDDYKFYNSDEVVTGLTIWGAKSVMKYTEDCIFADGSVIQQEYVRYYDHKDKEHILFIGTPAKVEGLDPAHCYIYELIV